MKPLICLLMMAVTCVAQDPREFMTPAYNGIFRISVQGRLCTLDRFGNTIGCRQVSHEVTGFAVDNDRSGRTLIATVRHGFEDDMPGMRFSVDNVIVYDVTGKRLTTQRFRDSGQPYRIASVHDMAVVTVKETYEPYSLAWFAPGENVYVFGWPKKYVLRRPMKVTGDRTYTNGRGQRINEFGYTPTTAEAPNSGFSGGPVFNQDGKVVGIHHGTRGGIDSAVPAYALTTWLEPMANTKLLKSHNEMKNGAARSRSAVAVSDRKEQREIPVPFSPEPQGGGVGRRTSQPPVQPPAQPSAPRASSPQYPPLRVAPTPSGYCRSMAEQQRLCQEAWMRWIDERIQQRMPEGREGRQGPAGNPGAAGKSAYDIAVEMGFRGNKAEWLRSLQGANGIDGINGMDGAEGPPGMDAQIDLASLAAVLAQNHADRLRGPQGDAGTDGSSVTAAELRPLITDIVTELLAANQQTNLVIPDLDQLDRIIDAWIATNSDRINARIDARVNQIIDQRLGSGSGGTARPDSEIELIANRVYDSRKRQARVMVIDSSRDPRNPAVINRPETYDLDREPIILDMADFVRK